MPRVNLSISQELYDQSKKAADDNFLSVNNMIVNELEKAFSVGNVYDYSYAMESLIKESEDMKAEFTLSDLPTFKNVDRIIIEYGIKESAASVRARLGKIYNEAIRNGLIKGIDRANVNKDGEMEAKFLSRAAVYVKKIDDAR